MDFDLDHHSEAGVLEVLRPGLRRITAPNPSPFTFRGTGTLIVGRGRVAVIDPGPNDETHINTLLEHLSGEVISHILVTHTHADHSPGCRLLQQQVDAPTYGYGPHGVVRHKQPPDCLETGFDSGGDTEFEPDIVLEHLDVITGDDWELQALHTPGHTSNHLCFAEPSTRCVYTGDHVMGWSTTIVSPPDGDMGDYLNSLKLLLGRDDHIYWPIHGGPVRDPQRYVKSLIDHRYQRETRVLDAIASGYGSLDAMLPIIYNDIDPSLYPAAKRSLLATIIFLIENNKVVTSNRHGNTAFYTIP